MKEKIMSPAQVRLISKLVDIGCATQKEWINLGPLGTLMALRNAKWVASSPDRHRPGSYVTYITDAGAEAYLAALRRIK